MPVQFGGDAVNAISFNGSDVNAGFFNGNLVFGKAIASSYLTVSGNYLTSHIVSDAASIYKAPTYTVLELKNLIDLPNSVLHVYNSGGIELADNAAATTGATVAFEVDNVTIDSKIFVLKGDCNGDGIIDNSDVTLMNDPSQITDPVMLFAADTNDDGVINYKDRGADINYMNRTLFESNSTYMNIATDYVIVNVVAGQGAPSPKDPPLTVSEFKALFTNSSTNIFVYGQNSNLLSDNDNVGTKMVVKNDPSGVVLETKTIILVGDVNNDGDIDMVDYGIINNHVSGTTPITDPVDLIAADVNEDGSITQTDANLVRNYYENS